MTTYYPPFIKSRILYDADRTGVQAENVNVTGWLKTAKFILCVQMGYNGEDTAASAYKWQWRNDTDSPGGDFNDVSATSEIAWAGTSAVLVDGNAVDDAAPDDRRCSVVADQTWQDGLENVGDNLTPDAGTFDLGNDCFTEFQNAFDPAVAHENDTYSLRLYNNTAGAAVGNGTYVTITMAANQPSVVLNTADLTEFDTSMPTLEFTGTDASDSDVRYNIQISDGSPGAFVDQISGTKYWWGISVNPTNGDVWACVSGGSIWKGEALTFTLDKVSGTDLGFANTTDGGDIDPFDSGDKCDYDVQVGDALADGTYYWRVRGMDPVPGSGSYGCKIAG